MTARQLVGFWIAFVWFVVAIITLVVVVATVEPGRFPGGSLLGAAIFLFSAGGIFNFCNWILALMFTGEPEQQERDNP